MLVDLDRAKSKRVRDAMRTLHVLRPDGGIEAVDDIVRRLDRLRLVRELLDVHDGSEDLLAGDSHGGIRVDEGGGFVVPSLLEGLALRPLAAERELRSFVRADFDVVLDLLPLLRRDEGSEVRRSLQRIAHADRLEPFEEFVLELLVHLVLDDEARGLRAILATVHHGGRDGAFGRGGDVRVLEDDEGGLAAQLQVELLHVRGRRFHDFLPRRGVTGQGDHVDLVARCEFVPDDGPGTRDQVHGAGGNPGRLDQLPELERRERRQRRGLQDGRIPRGERGRELPDRHHERIVPWRDLTDHPDRLPADHARRAVRVFHRRLPGQRPGGARHEPQVVHAERQVAVPGLLDRLPLVL